MIRIMSLVPHRRLAQHNRFSFSPRILLPALLASLAITLNWFAPKPLFSQSGARPNIVLIYTDDQGYGDVGALNPEAKFETPNFDRLANEGMTFTDGHCADSVCTPSRYGLLTGRYCWRTRLKKGVLGADGPCLIKPGQVTLASFLRDQGYQTAMIGKWHLGMEFVGSKGEGRDWSQPFTDGPIEKGFDRFFGIPASMNYGVLTYLDQDRITSPPTLWTMKKPGWVGHDPASYRIAPPYQATAKQVIGGKRGEANRLEVAHDFVDQKVLQVLTEKSIEWIEHANRVEKPFFLYLPYTSPHKPVVPMNKFKGKSKCGAYGDFLIETDFRVGQILAKLDQLGIADNTMVILTSDNGPENTWKKRIDVFRHHSAGIYRGGKRSRYEGGHRVPFLIRWPAMIKPNSKCDIAVCQTDFLATFAELVDQPLPKNAGEDSESFYQGLLGKPFRRGPIVHHSVDGQFAIRDGNWKLIVNEPKNATKKQAPEKEPVFELYHLSNDPSESKNDSSHHPEIVTRLREQLAKIQRNED